MEKKKIIAIYAAALILGTIFTSSISAQIIEMNQVFPSTIGKIVEINTQENLKYNKPDLVVKKFSSYMFGFIVLWCIDFKNIGTQSIPSGTYIHVKYQIKQPFTNNVVYEDITGVAYSKDLPPGSGGQCTVNGDSGLNGYYKVSFTIDPKNRIDESNEVNNKKTMYVYFFWGQVVLTVESMTSNNPVIINHIISRKVSSLVKSC